ncbi:MAG: hypothetical protein IKK85_01700 [Clostridia bacterium]|nr:hypothetical protein [Clostridia bacterium]
MTADFLLDNEKKLGLEIDAMTAENPTAAVDFVVNILKENEELFSHSRAVSACLARLTSRCLMHRKNKDGMIKALSENAYLRSVYFGRLNTYKYSLIFTAKRVMRKGNVEISREIIELIRNNPYRDDTAEDYSERFSWRFIAKKILDSQEEYLKLSDEIIAMLQ